MQSFRAILVIGGIENNQPIGKTSLIYPDGYNYNLNIPLHVPRYYHACGAYNDPADNLEVNIQFLSIYLIRLLTCTY